MRVAQLEGVHPTVTIEDCLEAEEIVKADAGIIKLLKERYGLTPERVAFDPWYYGDRCACLFSRQLLSSPDSSGLSLLAKYGTFGCCYGSC